MQIRDQVSCSYANESSFEVTSIRSAVVEQGRVKIKSTVCKNKSKIHKKKNPVMTRKNANNPSLQRKNESVKKFHRCQCCIEYDYSEFISLYTGILIPW